MCSFKKIQKHNFVILTNGDILAVKEIGVREIIIIRSPHTLELCAVCYSVPMYFYSL